MHAEYAYCRRRCHGPTAAWTVELDSSAHPRHALPGDLLEPVPRRRRRSGRRCDQLGDSRVRGRPPFARAPAGSPDEPPLGALGKRIKARVVRRPVERRVVFEVDGNELRIVDRVELVRKPDGGRFRRSRLEQDPAVALRLHAAPAYAKFAKPVEVVGDVCGNEKPVTGTEPRDPLASATDLPGPLLQVAVDVG